jgi:hypothetical protein
MRKWGKVEWRTKAGGFVQVVAYGNIKLENKLNTNKTVIHDIVDTMLSTTLPLSYIIMCR